MSDLEQYTNEKSIREAGKLRSEGKDYIMQDGDVVNFALKAFDLDGEKLSTADIRAILTSDLSDSESVAGKYGDKRYLEFAAAFNFDTDGTIERDAMRVQSVTAMLTTQDLYLRQKMEEEAGGAAPKTPQRGRAPTATPRTRWARSTRAGEGQLDEG